MRTETNANESAAKIISKQPTAELVTINVNGREIVKTYADGRWWVAIKPICEVLNVNYNRQFQNLKEEEILGQLFANQQTVGADGKQREMVCIPEKYIYGWVFGLESKSPELRAYKLECYDVLYNHFHGGQGRRNIVLKETTLIDLEIEEAKKEVEDSPAVQKLNKLLEKKKLGIKTLKLLDQEIVGKQYSLWQEESRIDASKA